MAYNLNSSMHNEDPVMPPSAQQQALAAAVATEFSAAASAMPESPTEGGPGSPDAEVALHVSFDEWAAAQEATDLQAQAAAARWDSSLDEARGGGGGCRRSLEFALRPGPESPAAMETGWPAAEPPAAAAVLMQQPNGVPGQPQAESEAASPAASRHSSDSADIPPWSGELYCKASIGEEATEVSALCIGGETSWPAAASLHAQEPANGARMLFLPAATPMAPVFHRKQLDSPSAGGSDAACGPAELGMVMESAPEGHLDAVHAGSAPLWNRGAAHLASCNSSQHSSLTDEGRDAYTPLQGSWMHAVLASGSAGPAAAAGTADPAAAAGCGGPAASELLAAADCDMAAFGHELGPVDDDSGEEQMPEEQFADADAAAGSHILRNFADAPPLRPILTRPDATVQRTSAGSEASSASGSSAAGIVCRMPSLSAKKRPRRVLAFPERPQQLLAAGRAATAVAAAAGKQRAAAMCAAGRLQAATAMDISSRTGIAMTRKLKQKLQPVQHK